MAVIRAGLAIAMCPTSQASEPACKLWRSEDASCWPHTLQQLLLALSCCFCTACLAPGMSAWSAGSFLVDGTKVEQQSLQGEERLGKPRTEWIRDDLRVHRRAPLASAVLRLTLVDLAGSEKVSKNECVGETFEEVPPSTELEVRVRSLSPQLKLLQPKFRPRRSTGL